MARPSSPSASRFRARVIAETLNCSACSLRATSLSPECCRHHRKVSIPLSINWPSLAAKTASFIAAYRLNMDKLLVAAHVHIRTGEGSSQEMHMKLGQEMREDLLFFLG